MGRGCWRRWKGILKAKGLKGLDSRTLRDCRTLSQVYPQIRGTVSPEFALAMGQAMSVESQKRIRGATSPELPTPLSVEEILRFSWSHLQELIRLNDPWKRALYENECLQGHWSVRQLQRQIESLLYERTGLSTDKKAIIERARKQEPQATVADMLRDPYIRGKKRWVQVVTGLSRAFALVASVSRREIDSAWIRELAISESPHSTRRQGPALGPEAGDAEDEAEETGEANQRTGPRGWFRRCRDWWRGCGIAAGSLGGIALFAGLNTGQGVGRLYVEIKGRSGGKGAEGMPTGMNRPEDGLTLR